MVLTACTTQTCNSHHRDSGKLRGNKPSKNTSNHDLTAQNQSSTLRPALLRRPDGLGHGQGAETGNDHRPVLPRWLCSSVLCNFIPIYFKTAQTTKVWTYLWWQMTNWVISTWSRGLLPEPPEEKMNSFGTIKRQVSREEKKTCYSVTVCGSTWISSSYFIHSYGSLTSKPLKF